MSLFTPESVVPDIDTIKFIADDRATSYPLTELDSSLSKLRVMKKKYDALLKKNIALKNEEKYGCYGTVPTSSSCVQPDDTINQQQNTTDKECDEDREQKEFDSLRVSTREYTGFTKIGPDLYSKISNPCFICNESAVIFYTRYNMINLKHKTGPHH